MQFLHLHENFSIVFMYDHESERKARHQFGPVVFLQTAAESNECQKCKITLERRDAQGLMLSQQYHFCIIILDTTIV